MLFVMRRRIPQGAMVLTPAYYGRGGALVGEFQMAQVFLLRVESGCLKTEPSTMPAEGEWEVVPVKLAPAKEQ